MCLVLMQGHYWIQYVSRNVLEIDFKKQEGDFIEKEKEGDGKVGLVGEGGHH